MHTLVLDPRWPEQIPLGAIGRLRAPLDFADDVPAPVRKHLAALAGPDGDITRVVCGLSPATEADATAELVPSLGDPLAVARRVMARSVGLGQWEARQTHASLLPYLAEEAGEFAAAVTADEGDDAVLAELGDVLLQVLFHAEIAQRRGAFTLDDVAESFTAKMRARAPYLFDGTTDMVPEDVQEQLWAAGKRQRT